MKRFVLDKFFPQYRTTIGSDFSTKDILIDDKAVSLQVILLYSHFQVWDTAGQERYQSLGVAFYKGAECCVLVYDITKAKSFQSLTNWKSEFLRQAAPKNEESFPFILIGNKADQEHDRKVATSTAKVWCEKNGNIPYYEASAKDQTNVKEAFEEAAKLSLKNHAYMT